MSSGWLSKRAANHVAAKQCGDAATLAASLYLLLMYTAHQQHAEMQRLLESCLTDTSLTPAAQHALAMARVQSREHLLLVRPCTIARLGAPEVRSNIKHVIAELRSAPTQPPSEAEQA